MAADIRKFLSVIALSFALLACDPNQPVGWIYYGDSAIGRGVEFVTRLHHCNYIDQTTGGLPAFSWDDSRRLSMANSIQSFTVFDRMALVWMTIGTVDRSFYLYADATIAGILEDRARDILALGAAHVFFVSYNDINPLPENPFRTRQEFVDLIDFDSIPGFTFVDLRDLNDIVVGVDNFHYSAEEHYLRAGAMHARVGGAVCR